MDNGGILFRLPDKVFDQVYMMSFVDVDNKIYSARYVTIINVHSDQLD